jgi:hypothetical protein
MDTGWHPEWFRLKPSKVHRHTAGHSHPTGVAGDLWSRIAVDRVLNSREGSACCFLALASAMAEDQDAPCARYAVLSFLQVPLNESCDECLLLAQQHTEAALTGGPLLQKSLKVDAARKALESHMATHNQTDRPISERIFD